MSSKEVFEAAYQVTGAVGPARVLVGLTEPKDSGLCTIREGPADVSQAILLNVAECRRHCFSSDLNSVRAFESAMQCRSRKVGAS